MASAAPGSTVIEPGAQIAQLKNQHTDLPGVAPRVVTHGNVGRAPCTWGAEYELLKRGR